MKKTFWSIAILWGCILWLTGYILGILMFYLVSTALIGWVIMPFGVAMTIWVLLKKVKLESFNSYIILGIIWMVIAIVFDYLFLVKVFRPADGYYKLDVYLYYILTFMLPLFVGLKKR